MDDDATTVAVDALRDDLRTAWHRFVDLVAPIRPQLHGHCRRLAGNVFDAEDLVQETLVRAFGRWGVSYGAVRDPQAYLLRTATHLWIDTMRRRERESRLRQAPPDHETSPPAPGELRSAGARLMRRLSPQERAAVVLKEGFDMRLDEIAQLLSTTEGAVKAALHRGRERLREPDEATSARRPAPSPDLVDRFVALVAQRDVPGLAALMLDGASAENPGNSFHVGDGGSEGVLRFLDSLVHGHPEWPRAFQPESRRLERAELDGESIVLGLATFRGREEAITSVFRLDEEDGRIARLRSYAFCPETLREIGARLGRPVLTGLYRAPTPAPGADWPETRASA